MPLGKRRHDAGGEGKSHPTSGFGRRQVSELRTNEQRMQNNDNKFYNELRQIKSKFEDLRICRI